MYIRMQHQSLRYRVSREEASQLLAGERLTNNIQLSPSMRFTFSVLAHQQSSTFTYQVEKNECALLINTEQLINEIKDRPTKQGISIDNAEQCDLAVSLEIDIKKR